MFDDLLESIVANKKKTNKSWAVVLSAVVQATMLGILILIPLIYTEALTKTMLMTMLIAPPPPPSPPSLRPVRTHVKRSTQIAKFTEPVTIPRPVSMTADTDPPPELIDNATETGAFSNIRGQEIIGSNAPVLPPPPKAAPPARIRQGSTLTAASIISQTKPIYPPLARQARIQGIVVLHAIIDKDGMVAELEVISGHPLLVRAAIDAVKQWRYKPTLLNEEPVEVDTTITVTFTMGS